MIELIKKTMLMGVGLAAMTRDKVEEMAREMARNAQLSSEKGQEFIDEVMQRADKAREEFEASVRKAVNDNLARTNVATRDDIADLKTRIEKLEALLSQKSS